MTQRPSKIPLSTFIDFVHCAGVKRISVVKGAKYDKYDPKSDFYKPLRDAIDEFHRGGETNASILLHLPASLSDPKKRNAYPALINAYLRFVKKHRVSRVHAAPKAEWNSGSLTVAVNPELAVEIDGKPHLIKLWLRTESIDRHRVPCVLALMRQAITVTDSMRIGVLDVRRRKLHANPNVREGVEILLRSEAKSFAEMFEQL